MNLGENLFTSGDLSHEFEITKHQISNAVNAIPKDEFLVSTEEELVNFVVHSLSLDPLVLHADKKTMTLGETTVEVSDDFAYSPRPPVRVPGTLTEINIPFSGDKKYFRCQASTVISPPPRGEVLNGILKLTFSHARGTAPEYIKAEVDGQIEKIKELVGYSYRDVTEFNASLASLVLPRVQSRKQLLSSQEDIAALIDIPISVNPDAPSISPIELVPRIKALPKPPKSGLAPEPGISEQDFEVILGYIRHQCRTFERSPHTFAVHGEEGLRDIVLAQLNGHFDGRATSETFRGSGKTDICIEAEDRMAFVGECKCWTGPACVGSAIDQLLKYLTWRDCKAALIIFNKKNKGFQAILDQTPDLLRSHDLYDTELASHSKPTGGEWRVVMRSVDDPGRRVHLHVFVINLHH